MLRRFLSAGTAPTAVRTFCATPVALASGFSVFLMQVYKDPAQSKELAVMPSFGARAKLIGKWYRGLSADDKAKLTATAKVQFSAGTARKKKVHV